MRYQKEMTLSPYQEAGRVNFEYDLYNFFADAHLGQAATFRRNGNSTKISSAVEKFGELKAIVKELVWQGRKGIHTSLARIIPNKWNSTVALAG